MASCTLRARASASRASWNAECPLDQPPQARPQEPAGPMRMSNHTPPPEQRMSALPVRGIGSTTHAVIADESALTPAASPAKCLTFRPGGPPHNHCEPRPSSTLTEYYPAGAPNRCVSLHSHHDSPWQRWTTPQMAVGRRPGSGVPCSAPWRGRTRDVRRGARRRRRSRSCGRTLPATAGRSRRSNCLAVRVERGATDRASTIPVDTAQARSGQGGTGRPAHDRCSPRRRARVAARRLR